MEAVLARLQALEDQNLQLQQDADNARAEAVNARQEAQLAQAAANAAAAAAAHGGGGPVLAAAAAPAAANPLLSLKLKISKHKGKDDENLPDVFFDQCEDYFIANRLTTDAEKTFAAQFHLEGEAKLWFRTFADSTGVTGNKSMAWDEFKREYTTYCLDASSADQIKEDFKKMRQVGPVKKYVEVFRKWILRYKASVALNNYYSDQIILDTFLGGLKREVHVHVKMSKPANLQAAYTAAIDTDTIVYTPTSQQGTAGAKKASQQQGFANTGSPNPSRFGSPAPPSRFGSRAPTPAPLSSLANTDLAALQPLLDLANLMSARAAQPANSNGTPSGAPSVASGASTPLQPSIAATGTGAIDWAKAGVTFVNGQRRVASMKDNEPMKAYCRSHGLCFRCRNPGCYAGNCKNAPAGPPRQFNNIDGDLIDFSDQDFQ
jgi:hypothetical protein